MVQNKFLSLLKMTFAAVLLVSGQAYALTAGTNYTVTIGKINSNGTETVLSTSEAVVADTNGKIAFSLSSIPDSTACNFMTVVIKDGAGAIAQSGVAPCATAGTTLPLGVSGVTSKQSEALKAGFAAAATDDPILAVFMLASVRTTGITSSELAALAVMMNNGIVNAGGFVPYLTGRSTNPVTTTQLAAYRSSIVAQLNDPSGGYSKLMKDSVDAAASTTEAGIRGEAAALLMEILIKAATAAGFPQDYVLEAFNAMGVIAVPAIMNSTVLTAATKQGLNSGIGGGIQKAKTSRVIEKYAAAITTLNGTGADVTQFTTAASTMTTTMRAAFNTFEQSAFRTGSESDITIRAAQVVLSAAMTAAFNQFITDVAASDARITTLIANVCNAVFTATHGSITVSQCTGYLQASYFKFHKPDGTSVNWPINMVVLDDWSVQIKAAGGGVTYTRDTTAIPSTMIWAGTCSDATKTNKTTCQAVSATWTAGRTCFGFTGTAASGEVGTCRGMPPDPAILAKIQEDINILEMDRHEAIEAGGGDMGHEETAEKDFTNALSTHIAAGIGGTTDGTTAISADQKAAVVRLMSSPQM